MRSQFTWLLAVGLIFAPSISHRSYAETSAKGLKLRNVELSERGVLSGQFLTLTGKPLANAEIIVRDQTDAGKVGQKLTTDSEGRFSVRGLRSGTCILESNERTYAVRVWKNGTAPPKSISSIALVNAAPEAVRGQLQDEEGPISRLKNVVESLSPTQVACLGLVLAGIVAIPLALDDGS